MGGGIRGPLPRKAESTNLRSGDAGMAQSRVRKGRTPVARPSQVHEDSRTQRVRSRGDAERAALKEELDQLLDEVDAVLEENAEDFVKQYIQKGGE